MSRYCPTTVITAERERDIETMMSRRFLSGTLPPSFSSFGNDHFPGNDRLRASARCAGATNQGHKGSFFTDKSPEEKAPNYCVCLLARPRVRRLSLAVNSVMRFDTAMTCTSINDSAGPGGRAGGERTGAGAGAVGGGSETNIPPTIHLSQLSGHQVSFRKQGKAGRNFFVWTSCRSSRHESQNLCFNIESGTSNLVGYLSEPRLDPS